MVLLDVAAVQLDEEEVTTDVVEEHCLCTVAVEALVERGWRGVVIPVAGSFKTSTHVISGLELVLLQLAVAFSNSEIAFVLSNVCAALEGFLMQALQMKRPLAGWLLVLPAHTA